MTTEHEKPKIIRRIKKIKKGGHHGGAWKMAYADFVTGMMTFFLLMWSLGLMNKYQLEGVAEYFKKPLDQAFEHSSAKSGRGDTNGEAKTKGKPLEHPTPAQGAGKTKEHEAGVSDKTKDGSSEIQEKTELKNTSASQTKSEGKEKKIEQKSAEQIKAELENKLKNDPKLQQFRNHLNFIITADGLKIIIHDLDKKPMFSTGKADFHKYASDILDWLSKTLNEYPNQITISGHTDTVPFSGSTITNWELSADRATAARQELIKNGMDENKIARIVGMGDKELLNKENGKDPMNRRVEILILNDDAMKKIGSK